MGSAVSEAETAMEHRLTNTGTRLNFRVLYKAVPSSGLAITCPFAISSDLPPEPVCAAIRGNKAVYVKRFEGQERIEFPIQGFAADTNHHDFRIEKRPWRRCADQVGSPVGAGATVVDSHSQ